MDLGFGFNLEVRHGICLGLTSREGGGGALDPGLPGGGTLVLWGVPAVDGAPFYLPDFSRGRDEIYVRDPRLLPVVFVRFFTSFRDTVATV